MRKFFITKRNPIFFPKNMGAKNVTKLRKLKDIREQLIQI